MICAVQNLKKPSTSGASPPTPPVGSGRPLDPSSITRTLIPPRLVPFLFEFDLLYRFSRYAPCIERVHCHEKGYWRLWHRCFPVNFGKFLRTPFLQNTSRRLLLLLVVLNYTCMRLSNDYCIYSCLIH